MRVVTFVVDTSAIIDANIAANRLNVMVVLAVIETVDSKNTARKTTNVADAEETTTLIVDSQYFSGVVTPLPSVLEFNGYLFNLQPCHNKLFCS